MEENFIEIFCNVDDFCKCFEKCYVHQLLSDNKKKRRRSSKLSLSEIVTIVLCYYKSNKNCFKNYYLEICWKYRTLFSNLVEYSRITRLIKKAFPIILCMLKSLQGEITEYLFIDATPITVCSTLREKSHKVFKGIAKKGKTSTGWFFGFKLHVIFNTKGELVKFCITSGNESDIKPVPNLMKNITAKLIGDKGYISKKLFDTLFKNGSFLITKIRKNMKNKLMNINDKIMLMKRPFVESIFSSIKSLSTFIHHRHRSPINAFTHIIAALLNYQMRHDKPSIHYIYKAFS